MSNNDAKVREMVAEMVEGLTNGMLAKVLRTYFDESAPAEERDAIGTFYGEHLAEMNRRKRSEAVATADAEREAFNAKHGIHEGMSDAELDAFFDGLSDEEFERETPRGHVWHLIEALEADPDNYS